MTEEQTREIAELIALRVRQGWHSQADRIWERALQEGVDDQELARMLVEAMR